ncbi:hypothetical protein GN956_G19724 [Arapaima gigas]
MAQAKDTEVSFSDVSHLLKEAVFGPGLAISRYRGCLTLRLGSWSSNRHQCQKSVFCSLEELPEGRVLCEQGTVMLCQSGERGDQPVRLGVVTQEQARNNLVWYSVSPLWVRDTDIIVSPRSPGC